MQLSILMTRGLNGVTLTHLTCILNSMSTMTHRLNGVGMIGAIQVEVGYFGWGDPRSVRQLWGVVDHQRPLALKTRHPPRVWVHQRYQELQQLWNKQILFYSVYVCVCVRVHVHACMCTCVSVLCVHVTDYICVVPFTSLNICFNITKYLLQYYNLNLAQNLPRTYILQFDLSDISVTLKRDQGHQNWQKQKKVTKSYD